VIAFYVAGATVAAGLGWGWFEAGWVRLRTLDLPVAGLPAALVGLRIAHLSDFHLGVPSRGSRAVERAVDWAAERQPDIVCITGDLLTHPRGERRLRELLERLPGAFAVLGNHDHGIARDPFAARSAPLDARPARLLVDEAETVEVRGARVQLIGLDPRTVLRRAEIVERLADPAADLRLVLSHYPGVVDVLRPGLAHVVLAGHMHDGQITVPYGFGKLRLAHPRHPYPVGIIRRPGATMHVSPGLGTTFVPFRFAARPEGTELLLASVAGGTSRPARCLRVESTGG
jgi:predicted MPP superfamily phosphohydrolase